VHREHDVKGPLSRGNPGPARFGEKLRWLRLQNEMTLQELASALGLSAHGYISELEAGKKQPTINLVLGVAKLFGVTTDELLKDEVQLGSRQQKDRK